MRAKWLTASLFFTAVFLSAGSAYANYERSRAWFNGLSAWERKGVQTNLILGGFYSGFADGKFGRNTYAALIAFEDQHSVFSNGMLNRLEANMLVSAARRWADNYQMRDASDDRAGISFPVPHALITRHRETERGALWTSGSFEIETAAYLASELPIERFYTGAIDPSVMPGLEYKFLGSNFFVLSGENAGMRYYSFYRENADYVSGFSVRWAAALQSRAARLPVYIVAKAKFYSPKWPVPPLPHEPEEDDLFPGGAPHAYVPPAPPPTAPRSAPSAESSGSGFFVSASGLILTNHHVTDGCSTLEVPGHGRAELLRSDADLDLAAILVKRPPPSQRTAVFDEKQAVLGSRVVAGGFPLSDILGNSFALTYGQVSSRGGMAMNQRDFSMSATLQPGNSGGAVVNIRGNVVGIARAKLNEAKLLEVVGTTGANFSFAIDALHARDFLRPFTLEPRRGHAGDNQPLSDEDLAASLESYSVQVLCKR